MQTLWSQRDHLVVKDGVLFREWEDVPGKGHNKCLQFVIPQDMVRYILQQLYDALEAILVLLRHLIRSVLVSTGLGSDRMWRIGASHVSYVQQVNPLLGKGRQNCRQNFPAIHSSGWQWTS